MTVKIDGTNTTANPGITGSDTDTGLQFGTNEVKVVTDGTARATVDSSGKLGVATTSPQSKLSVGNGASTDDGLSITFTGDDTVVAKYFANTSSGEVTIGGVATNYFPTFYSSGSEAMRLDSSGRLQIGTTTGTGNLNVAGTGDAAIDLIADSDDNGTNQWPIINFRRHSATGTPAARIYQKESSDSLIFDNNGADRLTIDNSGRVGIGATPQDFDGNGDNLVISSSTNTGITIDATSSTNSSLHFADGTSGSEAYRGYMVYVHSSDEMQMGVAGSTRMYVNSTGRMRVQGVYDETTGGAENVNVQSDGLMQRSVSSIKYKKDVETLEDSYSDALLALRPVWYKSKCASDNPDWGYWGFIAEELAEIDPRLVIWKTEEVSTDEDGNQVKTACDPEPEGVQYSRFVPHLLNLIKRQKTRIETLESQHADLLARVTALEATE